MLHLIDMWLTAPVIEKDDKGNDNISKPTQGTPQGGVISPLMANIYLHEFDKRCKAADGIEQKYGAKLVRYADDFVILARYIGEPIKQFVTHVIVEMLGLQINREKTRIVDMKEEGASVTFLGFTFRYARDIHGRDSEYLRITPSEKAQQRIRDRMREVVNPNRPVSTAEMVSNANRVLVGWANYYRFGYPRVAFRKVNDYVRMRFSRVIRHKSQRRCKQFDDTTIYDGLKRLGLVYL